MIKKLIVVSILFCTGLFLTFAQDTGRVEWYARARTDIQLNFSPKQLDEEGNEIDYPGIAFYEDDNGGAYGWDNGAELLVWYGKGSTSMWGIASYRMGWGFETKYNLSYDNNHNGNAGGKVQIGARFGSQPTAANGGYALFTVNRLSAYGWWQAWNKRILMEMNPFGAIEEEWGSIWKTPAWLFDDHDIVENLGYANEAAAYFDGNLDSFFRIQFRNVVDNLNFGFFLPNFGQMTNLNWGYYTKFVDGEEKYWEAQDIFMRAGFGFKYTDFDYAFAGGFKMDPDKKQRAYIGGEYKVMDQKLGIRADFKWNHIGAVADNLSDLDMAQGVDFRDGPWNFYFTLYERNLFFDENKQLELVGKFQGKYTITPRKLLARMRFFYTQGIAELNDKYHEFEIEPGIFWAIGSQGVSDDLEQYSGMYVRFNFIFGRTAADTTIDERKIIVGFRWAM